MRYDIAIVTVRPGTTPSALARLAQWLKSAPSRGRLLACWFTELGALNQILVLRGYDDDASLAADHEVLARSEDPFGMVEFTTGIEMDTYVPFPFMDSIRPGEIGSFFEVRTYRLKPDGLAATIELWRRAVPPRVRLSPLIAAMYSVSGAAPRFMHIWPWKSLDERQRVRAEAVATGVWPPPGGPDRLVAQQADIFLAAPFSPLR